MQTAKATFYNVNGTGRDTYIFNNNGGLTFDHRPNNQPPVGMPTTYIFIYCFLFCFFLYLYFSLIIIMIGTFVSPVKKHVETKKPLINSRSIQYHGNGTGRDSYIMYLYFEN